MKNVQFAAIVAVIGIMAVFAACDNGGNSSPEKKPLTGSVVIDGVAKQGETVTANVTGSNGTADKFTYQWTKTPEGQTAINITGADGKTYTITSDEVGFDLGVIVSNEDTLGTISAPLKKVAGPDPVPEIQAPETKNLTFGTGCKVTIQSDDKFLKADWDALCDKVVAAIMRGYDKTGINTALNKSVFANTFRNDISIVLSSSATHNCEVKDGDYTTIYLKTGVLDTVDVQPAVWALGDEEPFVAKAKIVPANGNNAVLANGGVWCQIL